MKDYIVCGKCETRVLKGMMRCGHCGNAIDLKGSDFDRPGEKAARGPIWMSGRTTSGLKKDRPIPGLISGYNMDSGEISAKER